MVRTVSIKRTQPEPITSLKIGPCTYAVVRSAITEYGLCDYKRQTITLQPDLHPTVERLVLWHEIIHAILYQLGYNDHDEKLVDGLAHSIVSVLTENNLQNGTTGGKA